MRARHAILLVAFVACTGEGAVSCDPTLTCAYDPSPPDPPVSRLAEECDRGCSPRFLTAGTDHSCANLGGDEHICWGGDDAMELGEVRETLGDATIGLPYGDQIAAGDHFSCAKIADRVACWGRGFPRSPALLTNGGSFVPGLGSVDLLAVGGDRICTIDRIGAVRCARPEIEARAISGIEGRATSLSVGIELACVIAGERREVYCFRGDVATPVEGLSNVDAIAVGPGHACAISELGLSCWGEGGSGELGNGTHESSDAPVHVLDQVLAVAAGGEIGAGYTLAIVEGERVLDGEVFSDRDFDDDLDGGIDRGPGGAFATTMHLHVFGSNRYGQLGFVGESDVLEPRQIIVLHQFASIAAGVRHACVSSPGLGLTCFGDDSSGQLGHEARGDTRVLETSMALFDGPWPRRRRDRQDRRDD